MLIRLDILIKLYNTYTCKHINLTVIPCITFYQVRFSKKER